MGYKNPDTQREYQRKWIASRREQFFKDKECVKCKSKDRLELDHIDPAEKITHNVWSWSEARRIVELAKCQVLCYSCHKEKTREYLAVEVHGLTMYDNYGCRCNVCTEAKKLKMKNYRIRKKYE